MGEKNFRSPRITSRDVRGKKERIGTALEIKRRQAFVPFSKEGR